MERRKVRMDSQSMIIDGASIGLGKRLEWPDDYFSLYGELNYQRYNLNNYNVYSFLFDNGTSNLLSFTDKTDKVFNKSKPDLSEKRIFIYSFSSG